MGFYLVHVRHWVNRGSRLGAHADRSHFGLKKYCEGWRVLAILGPSSTILALLPPLKNHDFYRECPISHTEG